MAGGSSLCIEGRILPLYGAHVSHEQFNFRWPLPHVAGSPDLEVLSASLTSARSSDLPRLLGLVGPYKLRLNLTALPCSHGIPQLHASDTNPGSIPEHLPCRPLKFRLPHWRIGSATSNTIDFGAILPFTVVPAYNLPVYASQCRTSHHARLGTRLPAKLCHGHHFRQLNFMSFQGATLHRSGRAGFPHPALALGDDAHAAQGIVMIDANRREPAIDQPPHSVPEEAAVLTAPRKR